MKVISIASWTQFSERINETIDKNHMYRGVRQESHELIPKIGRKGVLRDGWSKSVEEQMLEYFKLEALPFVGHRPDNNSDWLVIAQHHGMPTRLLDWSDSPLVGAYFAVEAGGNEGAAAVYVASPPAFVQTNIMGPFSIENLEVLAPPHFSTRITAQHALFTVHPKPTEPYDDDSLVKLVIPRKLCSDFKRILYRYGINRATLFPDLDGLASNIAYKFGHARK